eukprot:scaffold15706_cov190-Isochrysis_galbana.AAC.1
MRFKQYYQCEPQKYSWRRPPVIGHWPGRAGQWAPSPAHWVRSARRAIHWEKTKCILPVPSPPPSPRPNPGDPRPPSQNLAPWPPPPVSSGV